MPIATTNPATGEVLRTFDPASEADVDAALQRAAEAFREHRLTSYEQRAGWLRATADLLDAEAEQTARLMTTEMGKPLAQAVAEVRKCATACRFYADNGAAFLADEPLADPSSVQASRAYATWQPLGPVLAVMPWNFPLWQAMRFAAPALMAGNVGLLKHASNVPQTALYLADVLHRGGFPDGAFQTLLVGSDQVERILRDDRVVAATLTGSTPAGQAMARTAGEVLKKMVLELGGSDAYLVMPSADLEQAAATATKARCQNNGQSCIAAKRFVVHRDVAEEFTELFVARMSALRVGDPMDDATDVGPLATEQGRADVEELVEDAVKNGAGVACGGSRPDGPGWYYPPTVLTGMTPDMRAYHEELFGPVAQVHVADSLDDAIRIANDTVFGLGSNIWTRDDAEAQQFVERSEAGAVFVNGMTTSYAALPFGGVKTSGYGRELSAHGMREFCNLKTVWVG